jgi:hypothetical protein
VHNLFASSFYGQGRLFSYKLEALEFERYSCVLDLTDSKSLLLMGKPPSCMSSKVLQL